MRNEYESILQNNNADEENRSWIPERYKRLAPKKVGMLSKETN